MKKQPVPLPELDEATAHTLVHYLYTGKYQAPSVQIQKDNVLTLDYKLGTCVYCAAVRYKLPGLIELAKDKITSLGEDANIFEILSMARDHAFPFLPEEETWYPAYLENAITSAMTENPEPFRKPNFITQVEGNSRLLQVVWKTVMSNFARTSTTTLANDADAATSTVDSTIDTEEPIDDLETALPTNDAHNVPTAIEEKSIPTPTNTETIVQSPSKAPEAEVGSNQGESLELDDIEPTVENMQAPEPFTDELGFESSKTYQKMGKKSDQVADLDVTTSITTESGHKRSDSVVQGEEAMLLPKSEDNPNETVEPIEVSSQPTTESADVAATSKRSKKHKKKKSSAVFT